MKNYFDQEIQIDDIVAYGFRNGNTGGIRVLYIVEVNDNYVVASDPKNKYRKARYKRTKEQMIIINHQREQGQ